MSAPEEIQYTKLDESIASKTVTDLLLNTTDYDNDDKLADRLCFLLNIPGTL